jgi:hypothetical protein
MNTQEQTILTTYSERIYSVGEPGATASLEILKEETRAWHRIYCAENSCREISARRWVQIEDELERTGLIGNRQKNSSTALKSRGETVLAASGGFIGRVW